MTIEVNYADARNRENRLSESLIGIVGMNRGSRHVACVQSDPDWLFLLFTTLKSSALFLGFRPVDGGT